MTLLPSSDTPQEARRHDYKTLEGPHQIRLLQAWIEPTTARMTIEFTHVDLIQLSDSIRYRAFSYCWGDSTPSDKVWFVDGSYLEVAASAASIIRQIAEQDRRRTYNWIDAVCIDQENLDEKAEQVRQMRDVYAKAKQVMIWLDEEGCDAGTAFRHLSRVYNALTPLLQGDSQVNVEVVQNMPEFKHPSDGWTALARILDCPYFHRIWVIQEIIMATSPIIVISQGRTILYQAIEELVWNMNATGLRPYLHIDFPGGRREPRGWTTVLKLRLARERWQKGTRANFHGTLVGWSYCLSSDPRDKIFALLGISSDGECDELSIDYRIATETLYLNTARYLLTQNQSLLLLSCAGIAVPGRLPTLPSWVPDWTCTLQGRNFASYASWSKYNANGKTDCLARSDGEHVLLVDGRLVDEIDEFLDRHEIIPEDAAEYARQKYEWLEQARCFVTKSQERYTSRETSFEVLWRTLIANVDEHEQPVAADYGNRFKAYLDLARVGENNIPGTSSALKYALALRSFFVSERTLFRSKKGFVGLVSKRAQKEDRLCIFHGGHVPYILRETVQTATPGQSFLLVAQCYVHGLMNGEGLALGEERTIRLV